MLFISICLCSCDKETTYSCDESIDNWVHENLSEIRLMSRSEWNNLEEGLKIPVYRAFTLQQRVDFWNEKLTNVLALNWSEKEREHIGLLNKFINEHRSFLNGYDIMSDDEKNIFDLFFYGWMDKAKINFKWSDKLIYAILASGNTLIDTNGTLLVNQSSSRSSLLSSSESTCNCSQSSDWCTPIGWDCENAPCDKTSLGCGTILVYDCDGRCGGV